MAFLNDITLGQYFPGSSMVHRLDPRTKLIALMLLMTSLLASSLWSVMLIFMVVTAIAIVWSTIPMSLILKNLRPFIWLFGITIMVHLFWTPGRIAIILPVLGATITHEGLQNGLVYSVRLALLVLFAALLTLSTSPIELTDALEKLFSPLKRFKVPTHEIVMMLTLSLRFIPTLLEEAQRIKNAQISRGATFEGNLVKRMRSVVPLILPLFVSAFRRADELALAMDSRCYNGGNGRTSFKRLQFQRADYIVLAFAVALFSVTIWLQLIA